MVDSEYKLNYLYILLSCMFYPIKILLSHFNLKRVEYYKIAGCGYGNYAVKKVIEDIFGDKYPTIVIQYGDDEGGKFFYSQSQSDGSQVFMHSLSQTSASAFYMPNHTTYKVVNIIIPPELQNNTVDYSYFLKVIRALLLYGINYKIIVI